jgi:hypothetical protein
VSNWAWVQAWETGLAKVGGVVNVVKGMFVYKLINIWIRSNKQNSYVDLRHYAYDF